jgi:hypothetical protein
MLRDMSAASARPLAKYADLAALAEIIHGVIVEKAAPSFEHGVAQSALSGTIGQRFGRRGGPGGWWIASEVEVEYATHEVSRHDLAGWRRERVPEMPGIVPHATIKVNRRRAPRLANLN